MSIDRSKLRAHDGAVSSFEIQHGSTLFTCVQQQAQDFKSWAAEQLDKLRLDQQGMRERAEKQWAEIDHIREERHNANIGVDRCNPL